MRFRRTLAVVAVISLPSLAAADELGTGLTEDLEQAPRYNETRLAPLPPSADAAKGGNASISDIIYINGCWDGCSIEYEATGNDAINNISFIPDGNSTISPFSHGEELWNQTIECLREVYLPFNVQIVDSLTEPDPGDEGIFHHEAILAGLSSEIGQPPQVNGIAPISCDPSGGPVPINNAISFSFANQIPANVIELCWTVAQEAAHAYGLDHVFNCLDPMTYLPGCGQKFFRNEIVECGEVKERPCACNSGLQNSHQMLVNVFGEGEQPPPPEVSILGPGQDDTVEGDFTIYVRALDPRLVSRVELWVNGLMYAERAGHGYQDREDNYQFTAPAELPAESVFDLEVRAYNDLESMSTDTITVTRGAPCASADTCLEGQICADGRCRYRLDGQLGEACERSQDCESLLCPSNGGEFLCSAFCSVGAEGTCPDQFECLPAGGSGICWPVTETAGCCSVGPDRGPTPGQIALFLLVAAVLVRRRGGALTTDPAAGPGRPATGRARRE